jgi:hypothetical protein
MHRRGVGAVMSLESIYWGLSMEFIVWPDGRKSDAKLIEAVDYPDAIEEAANIFDVGSDQINVIEASRLGEAEYYGVDWVVK